MNLSVTALFCGVLIVSFALPWPASLAGPGLLVLVAIWRWRLELNRTNPIIAKLGGITFRRDAFCLNWWVKGSTGSGKSSSGINTLAHEVFKRDRSWGGLILDIRGDFSQEMIAIATHHGRSSDLIVLEVRPEGAADWVPKARLNLADGEHGTVAKMVADSNATLLMREDKGFFRKQATDNIAMALLGLRLTSFDVTLQNAFEVLCRESMMDVLLERLSKLPDPDAKKVFKHFSLSYRIKGAPEQFEGVRSTIENYLSYIRNESIAEVFCRPSTFDFSKALDSGKIIVVKAPQSLQLERQFISLMLKFRFYLHILSRFEKIAEERAKDNLLVLWGDEAQGIISASENGMGDDVMLALIRAARATAVFASHGISSFEAVVGETHARVIAQNLRNRVLFTGADQKDAEESANFIGKKIITTCERTWEGFRLRRRYIKEEKYITMPHTLRQLRPHRTVLVAGINPGKPKRLLLPPLDREGRVAAWFGWNSL